MFPPSTPQVSINSIPTPPPLPALHTMHLILSYTPRTSRREILETTLDGKHVPNPVAQQLWDNEQQNQRDDGSIKQWVTHLQVLSEDASAALVGERSYETVLVVEDERDQCNYVFFESNGVTQWCVAALPDPVDPGACLLPEAGNFPSFEHDFFSVPLVPVRTKTMRNLGALTNLVDLRPLLKANSVCHLVKIYLAGTRLESFCTEHLMFGNARLDQFFELLCGEQLKPNFTLRMVREGGLNISGTKYSYETAKTQRLLLKDSNWQPMEREFICLMAEPSATIHF